jgi:hypothetical protein
MSPVDTSAAGPSPSISIATAKPELRESNKRQSEAVAEVLVYIISALRSLIRGRLEPRDGTESEEEEEKR